MFSGTTEELAAFQAKIRAVAEEIAARLNELEELGSAVGMNAGEMATSAGKIRKLGGSWTLRTH